MNWDSSYELGLEIIDEQHQFLFERIGLIESAVAIGAPPAFVEAIISDLEKYSIDHFATEQALFVEYRYPDAETHCRQHQHFAATILEARKQLENDGQLDGEALLGYLREWFSKHILESDFAYGRFLKNR